MRRIKYAGGDYFADDRTADAVLQYARALAERNRVEILELRVGLTDGEARQASLLVGAGMPIVIEAAPRAAPEFDGQLAEPGQELRLRRLIDGLTKPPEYRLRPAAGPVDFIDEL